MTRTRWAFLVLFALVGSQAILAQQHANQQKGFDPAKLYNFNDIDHVNMFNGNLLITLPIGQRFPVAGQFSYGLNLIYNGNVWDVKYIGGLPNDWPNRRSNAGIGWTFSLGRLIPPSDVTNGTNGDIAQYLAFVYESPDGSDQLFEPEVNWATKSALSTLDAMRPNVPDSAYLRMKRNSNDTVRTIEFPDGTMQTFNLAGVNWQLVKAEDPFGNNYTVSYDATTWTIVDSAGRTQTVYFTTAAGTTSPQTIITRVDLTAFGGGAPATYVFNYGAAQEMERPPSDHSGPPPSYPPGPNVTVDLLRSVTLPSGEQYVMTYKAAPTYSGLDTGCISALQLPTLGSIEWDWDTVTFPASFGNVFRPFQRDSTPSGSVLQYAVGVVKRRTRNGSQVAEWQYYHDLTTPKLCMVWNADHTFKVNEAQPRQKATVMTAPDGTRTATYSSVFSEDGDDTNCPYIAQGWLWEEYGMPVTHYIPDPVGPQGANDSRYLSSQTYIGGSLVHTSLLDPLHIVFPVTGNPLRSRYANYEINTTARQERTSRDVYEDDAGCSGATCYTITYGSSSDLFGRYRQLSRSSNFPVGPGTVPAITTFTNYIAPNLADPLWLHGLYTEKCSLAEPALDTTPASNCFGLVGTNPFLLPGVDFTSEQFNFNSKGFLLRHRILAGSGLGANDVLQVFDADSLGNNTLERYYGGDKQSIDHANPLPVMPLPSTPVYSITNTYSKGSLATSLYSATAFDSAKTPAVSFLSVDNDVDATGLVSTSRDSAGIATAFTYDTSGRLTETRQKNAQNTTVSAITSYSYGSATSSAPAAVNITQKSTDGTTTLSQARYEFDALGRIQNEKHAIPNSTDWSSRPSTFDLLGRKSSQFEAEVTPTHFTTFTYDSFGRLLTSTAPDGAQSTTTYAGTTGAGVRTVDRSSTVATEDGDLQSVSHELYDGFGRLIKVTQNPTNPSATADNIVADYGFDVSSHLASVSMSAVSTGGVVHPPVQTRTFHYDARGFLDSEQHPESGLTTYGDFDPRGHAGLKSQSLAQSYFDQNFTFDAAERLVAVGTRDPNYPTHSNTLFRPHKEFVYGTANNAPDLVNGRLQKASRYNYEVIQPFGNAAPPNPGEFKVVDTYAYTDPAGRRTGKTTEIWKGTVNSFGPPTYALIRSVVQSRTLNDLGLPSAVSYPTCLSCGTPPGGATAPSVQPTYSEGRVISIPSYLNSVSYAPSGMVSSISHSNGITDTIAVDPTGLARPRSFKFASWSTCTPPVITSQPASQTFSMVSTASLIAAASGSSPISYQWYEVSTDDTWTLISGATSSEYDFTASTTKRYGVIATNICRSVKSDVATVTVNLATAPRVTSDPLTQTAAKDTNVTVSVTATGTSPLSYQWYHLVNGVTTTTGTGQSSYTFAATVTDSYWVQVSNSAGSATSATAVITVPLPRPTALSATVSTTVNNTINLAWTGSTGVHHYQLERRSSGAPFFLLADIPAGTTSRADSVSPGVTYVYRVRAVDANGGSASPYSNIDLATILSFSSLSGNPTIIRAAHFDELLTALNALRAANGAAAVSWSNILPAGVLAPASGRTISTAHITSLRTWFDLALLGIGMPVSAYTDPQPVFVKTQHLIELRQRTQ